MFKTIQNYCTYMYVEFILNYVDFLFLLRIHETAYCDSCLDLKWTLK